MKKSSFDHLTLEYLAADLLKRNGYKAIYITAVASDGKIMSASYSQQKVSRASELRRKFKKVPHR